MTSLNDSFFTYERVFRGVWKRNRRLTSSPFFLADFLIASRFHYFSEYLVCIFGAFPDRTFHILLVMQTCQCIFPSFLLLFFSSVFFNTCTQRAHLARLSANLSPPLYYPGVCFHCKFACVYFLINFRTLNCWFVSNLFWYHRPNESPWSHSSITTSLKTQFADWLNRFGFRKRIFFIWFCLPSLLFPNTTGLFNLIRLSSSRLVCFV